MNIHPNHDKDLYNAAKAANASKALLAVILATPAGTPLDGTVAPVAPARRLRQPSRTWKSDIKDNTDKRPVSGPKGRPAQALPVSGDAGKLRTECTRKPGERNDTRTVTVRTVTPVPVPAEIRAERLHAARVTRTGRVAGTLADTVKTPAQLVAGTRDWSTREDVAPRSHAQHVHPRSHAELVALGIVTD